MFAICLPCRAQQSVGSRTTYVLGKILPPPLSNDHLWELQEGSTQPIPKITRDTGSLAQICTKHHEKWGAQDQGQTNGSDLLRKDLKSALDKPLSTNCISWPSQHVRTNDKQYQESHSHQYFCWHSTLLIAATQGSSLLLSRGSHHLLYQQLLGTENDTIQTAQDLECHKSSTTNKETHIPGVMLRMKDSTNWVSRQQPPCGHSDTVFVL